MARTMADRFWRQVEVGPGDECWPWRGAVNPLHGYGQWSYAHNKHEYAHRLAWQFTFGVIPKHLQVDHICENILCCNPAHLQLLTASAHGHKSNVQRWGHVGTEEVCRHGHVGERSINSQGRPYCRACNREQMRRRRGTHTRPIIGTGHEQAAP